VVVNSVLDHMIRLVTEAIKWCSWHGASLGSLSSDISCDCRLQSDVRQDVRDS
jgi:hypothetical protein